MRRALSVDGHAGQMEFWGSAAAIKGFVGGIGSGKTVAGVVEVLRQRPGSRGMISAPEHAILERATVLTLLDMLGPLVAEQRRAERFIRLRNGTQFWYWSCKDADRLRGPTLDWVWIDEAALASQEAYKILLGRLRRSEQARIWLTGSPMGRNWVYRTLADPETRDPGAHLVQWDTRRNPWLPGEFVRRLEHEYEGDFASQELAGEFVAAGGLRFRRRGCHVGTWQEFADHYSLGGDPERLARDRERFTAVGGFDFGTSDRPTAGSCAHVHLLGPDKRLWTVAECWMRGLDLDTQAARLREFFGPWKVARIWCDPALKGRGDLAESRLLRFKRAGVGMRPAVNDRASGWSTLEHWLGLDDADAARWRILPECKRLIQFLDEAPRDEHDPEDVDGDFELDHAGDAARYALHSWLPVPPAPPVRAYGVHPEILRLRGL